LEESLLQTNLGLQKYDQERSAFLASVAHDMRAPATALLGYCGMLLDRESGAGDDARKAILRHMQNSAGRLSRMISAIFELSVEFQNAHKVDLQTGDVLTCVDQAWHEVALIAADKKIAIHASIESIADLYFDRALLERVLINIFENACRFTPFNGRIEVRGYPFFWERRIVNAMIPTSVERRASARSAPNSFRVDIWNSGPPIPSELLEYIFEQYVSLEEPSRARWGCGLGLAICRTIIAQHRGRIWAQNTESGPKFCFVLPAGRPRGSAGDGVGEGWQVNETINWQKENANASI
jgi:two-component system sensor histidine kinase KdpD